MSRRIVASDLHFLEAPDSPSRCVRAHSQGDNRGPPPIGAISFRSGLSIVTQQFDPFKERKLLEAISERENLVDAVVDEAKRCADYKPYNPKRFVTCCLQLRFASMRVVEGILDWRKGLVNPEPFLVAGTNYLLKMIRDLEILRVMPTVELFGFEMGLRNPFVFPCMPRIAVRKEMAERKQKQLLEKKAKKKKKDEEERRRKKRRGDNDNDVEQEDKNNSLKKSPHSNLGKEELILPRVKEEIEAIVPDKEMHKLMLDFSRVAENHWVQICNYEAVLKEEEARYTKKTSGPAVAGTGWGLERWSKMAWAPPKTKSGKHRDGNATIEEREDEMQESGNHHLKGEARRAGVRGVGGTQSTQSSEKENKKKRESRRDGKRARSKKDSSFASLSKEDKVNAMANALREEKVAMQDKGRSAKIPSTADLVNELDLLTKGKVPAKESSLSSPSSSPTKSGSRPNQRKPERAAKASHQHQQQAAEHPKQQTTTSSTDSTTDAAAAASTAAFNISINKAKVSSAKATTATTAKFTYDTPHFPPPFPKTAPPKDPWDFDPSIEILSHASGDQSSVEKSLPKKEK